MSDDPFPHPFSIISILLSRLNANLPMWENFILNTVMRNVWNLRRGSEEGAEEQIVEFIHAKCSDRKLYPKSAVELNPNTLHYNHLPNFDHDAWQLKLENDARSGSTLSAAERSQAKQEKQTQDLANVEKMFAESDTLLSQEQYDQKVANLNITQTDARKIKVSFWPTERSDNSSKRKAAASITMDEAMS